jgi:hypothetical protein
MEFIRTLPCHCGSTNDGHSGVRDAANNNGQDRSFGNSRIWVLKKKLLIRLIDFYQVLISDLTFRSPETLAPARIPILAGK